jgi:predicted nucleic acid-binding Zn ribbon protein
MATAVEQKTCDRCGAELRKNAAYCDECGERTHRARRMVRLAIRVELLALVLVVVLILGFAFVYSAQR